MTNPTANPGTTGPLHPAEPGIRVAVPDLGGIGEGLPEWEPLEELLLTLDGWESQQPEDGEDTEPMDLPAPIRGGLALAALQRVLVLLYRTQGERAAKAGATGRLLSPADGHEVAPELYPAGRLVERAMLHTFTAAAADIATLAALPAALTSGDDDVIDAATQLAEDRGIPAADATAHMRTLAERIHALITASTDRPADQTAVLDLLEASPPAADVVLDDAQHTAYRALTIHILKAVGAGPLDIFAAIG